MATRTWVSGVGDDANPCSRTAPCKTFAGAISKTDPRGEISVIDPGGFGAVTITKSITIDGGTGSGFASILASGISGIIINAGAGDIVTLRNLSINGGGTGVAGIRILGAGTVIVEDCVIFNFRGTVGTDAGRGIRDVRSTGGRLFISNTTLRDNLLTAIVVSAPTGTPRISVVIDKVRLEGNGEGISVANGALLMVSNSVIAGNGAFGIVAQTPAGSSANTEVNVEGCVISQNATGVGVQTGSPTVRLSSTHITNNIVGVSLVSGTVESFGNNRITANGSGNAPSPVAPIPLR
jgi:hypothetical protein